jgi:hypothetical protein
MKNKKLPEILEKLKKVSLTGKTAYAVARNIKIIEDEIDIMGNMVKPNSDFIKYEKERTELATKHAKKDEKGKAIIENKEYILENKEEFDKEFAILKEKHKEAIDFRTKQLEDFNKFAEEESKLEFYKINEDEIPETATVDDYYVLGYFIK